MYASRKVVVHLAKRTHWIIFRDQPEPGHFGNVNALFDVSDPILLTSVSDLEHIVRLASDVPFEVTNPSAEPVPRIACIGLVFVDHFRQIDRFLRQSGEVRRFCTQPVQSVVDVSVKSPVNKLAPKPQLLNVGNHAAHPLTTKTLVLSIDRQPSTRANALTTSQQRSKTLEIQTFVAELVHKTASPQAHVQV